jgi:hypothetical protein
VSKYKIYLEKAQKQNYNESGMTPNADAIKMTFKSMPNNIKKFLSFKDNQEDILLLPHTVTDAISELIEYKTQYYEDNKDEIKENAMELDKEYKLFKKLGSDIYNVGIRYYTASEMPTTDKTSYPQNIKNIEKYIKDDNASLMQNNLIFFNEFKNSILMMISTIKNSYIEGTKSIANDNEYKDTVIKGIKTFNEVEMILRK